MLFEQAYEVFLENHIRHREGERRGRLERGHMHAQAIGFRMLSFAYDDIVTRADQCIFQLRMVLNRYTTLEILNQTLTMLDRESILLALAHSSPLHPIDIERHLNISHRTAVKVLRSLVVRGYFHQIESGTGQRTRFYQVIYNTCGFI